MAKNITFDPECIDKLVKGVKKIGDAVNTTLGPRGLCAVLDRSWGEAKVTLDGASVAEEVDLKDRVENVAARVIRSACEKTNKDAGDGSTTSAVLAGALFLGGARGAVGGNNPMLIARGIRKAVDAAVSHLEKASRKLESPDQVRDVATVAASRDRVLGKIIAEAMEKLGEDGIVTAEEGQSLTTELEVVQGMEYDRGYLSPHFVTDEERMRVELEDPYILLMEDKVSNVPQIVPVLEAVSKKRKPLLIMAEDVEGEALSTLVVNKMRKKLKCCAVKAPGYGDRRKALLGDIAVMTGGTVISKALGIKPENIKLDHLGRAKKVRVTNDETTIIQGAGQKAAIEARAAQVRKELEDTTSDYDREKLEERLASLVGGVAQINVGGATEGEVKEKKARCECAINAAKAAVKTGILPGGGVAFLRAAEAIDGVKAENDEEKLGVEIVRKALQAPIRQLASNAGYEPAPIIRRVLRDASSGGAEGFDFVRGEFTDLVKAGIVDPLKVVKAALLNACSAAIMLLTTEVVVTDMPKKKPKTKAPAGSDMDYM